MRQAHEVPERGELPGAAVPRPSSVASGTQEEAAHTPMARAAEAAGRAAPRPGEQNSFAAFCASPSTARNPALRDNTPQVDDAGEGTARRPVDAKNVEALAASMKEIGLQSPICLRYLPERPNTTIGTSDSIVLVAGRHRLEAAKSLGWDKIEAFYIDCDDLRAELAEIDENLVRAVLTPAQEAEAIARRKAIYEELHPETKHGANQHTRGVDILSTPETKRFTAATSEATGKDERAIRRAAARGEALGDDLAQIADTSLDKGVELDALAKMDPEARKPIIERARAGEGVSASALGETSCPARAVERRAFARQ